MLRLNLQKRIAHIDEMQDPPNPNNITEFESPNEPHRTVRQLARPLPLRPFSE